MEKGDQLAIQNLPVILGARPLCNLGGERSPDLFVQRIGNDNQSRRHIFDEVFNQGHSRLPVLGCVAQVMRSSTARARQFEHTPRCISVNDTTAVAPQAQVRTRLTGFAAAGTAKRYS
jgi:hypothetical protein